MDAVLIGVAIALSTPLAVMAVVVARPIRRPPEVDEPYARVDRELIEQEAARRQALAQERAAAARLRGERRVVCELQPNRETHRE